MAWFIINSSDFLCEHPLHCAKTKSHVQETAHENHEIEAAEWCGLLLGSCWVCTMRGKEVEKSGKEFFDWENGEQMRQRSAMNCLHNCAVGKMHLEQESTNDPSPKNRVISIFLKYFPGHCFRPQNNKIRSSRQISVSFAEQLEKVYEVDTIFSNEDNCTTIPVLEGGTLSSTVKSCSLRRDGKQFTENQSSAIFHFPFPGSSADPLLDSIQFPAIE